MTAKNDLKQITFLLVQTMPMADQNWVIVIVYTSLIALPK